MVSVVRLLLAALLFGAAIFCVFGIMAAPEAGDAAGSVRLLYGAGGLFCTGVAVWLAWPRRAAAP